MNKKHIKRIEAKYDMVGYYTGKLKTGKLVLFLPERRSSYLMKGLVSGLSSGYWKVDLFDTNKFFYEVPPNKVVKVLDQEEHPELFL